MPAADADRLWALVVVNYASAHFLEKNLVASAELAAPDRVVVVDNLSDAEERERVRRLARRHDWTLVESPDNAGFGTGVNAGVAEARRSGARDVLLLNPDARVADAGTAATLRAAARADGLAVLAPRILDEAGRVWFEGADVYLDDGTTRGAAKRSLHPDAPRWPWLTGAALWIPEESWDLVGGFDDRYFLYWEDVDFSRRLEEAGVALEVVPAAVVVHDEGGTHRETTGRAKSSVYYYFNIRNRMLFAAAHLDADGIRRWRRGIPASAREILLRGGRRQFLSPLAPLRAAWRGMRDARRIADAALAKPR